MSFLSLIIKNLFRSKARTFLTTLGISMGIATIVSFGSITAGLNESMSAMFRPGATDFSIMRAGSADVVLSFLDPEQLNYVATFEGIDAAIPYVMSFTQSGSNPFFLIGGLPSTDLETFGVDLYEGAPYSSADEVILGRIVAKNRNLGVGDLILIHDKEYKITGLFESGLTFQDGGALTTIEEAQRVQGLNDQVNIIGVVVSDGVNPRELASELEAARSDLLAVADSSDFAAADAGLELTGQITLVISILAVFIGSIGVMNTIIMSVYERTKEIGILKSLGWTKKRIVAMILGESLLIGLAAAVLGIFIGMGFIFALTQTEMGESWLYVSYEPEVFIAAFSVSVGVVLFGSLYPALKASKLDPVEAIRYE